MEDNMKTNTAVNHATNYCISSSDGKAYVEIEALAVADMLKMYGIDLFKLVPFLLDDERRRFDAHGRYSCKLDVDCFGMRISLKPMENQYRTEDCCQYPGSSKSDDEHSDPDSESGFQNTLINTKNSENTLPSRVYSTSTRTWEFINDRVAAEFKSATGEDLHKKCKQALDNLERLIPSASGWVGLVIDNDNVYCPSYNIHWLESK